MTVEEQLKRWVAGESVHNPTRDECCPDFSCCRPELKANKRTRQRFQRATAHQRQKMLGGFLGKMLENAGCKVRTA